MRTPGLTAKSEVFTVGRTYAGVLGPIGFFAMTLRGWKQGAGVEPLLLSALLALVALAAVGYIVGRLAAWTVEDSLKTQIDRELAVGKADAVASGAQRSP
jgi:hypothetical protein